MDLRGQVDNFTDTHYPHAVAPDGVTPGRMQARSGMGKPRIPRPWKVAATVAPE